MCKLCVCVWIVAAKWIIIPTEYLFVIERVHYLLWPSPSLSRYACLILPSSFANLFESIPTRIRIQMLRSADFYFILLELFSKFRLVSAGISMSLLFVMKQLVDAIAVVAAKAAAAAVVMNCFREPHE